MHWSSSFPVAPSCGGAAVGGRPMGVPNRVAVAVTMIMRVPVIVADGLVSGTGGSDGGRVALGSRVGLDGGWAVSVSAIVGARVGISVGGGGCAVSVGRGLGC